ncbi:hypothetical protein MKEN_00261500 [Mycena kentingensis (nom. inval.)]|nr:hypothetical protein MKEN_00261500 [Mycena kentingensis (nom. inval.)]
MQPSTFLDPVEWVLSVRWNRVADWLRSALWHHYSLCPISLPPNVPVQTAYTAQVLASSTRARLPTHLLALPTTTPNGPSTILLPVDANAYHDAFENASLVPQTTNRPTPIVDPATQLPLLTLPVIPVSVPHAPSLALVLLFGLGLETDRNVLATHLLPDEAIGEFPNAAAMSGVVSRLRTPQFDFYWELNQGVWKNTLCLAAKSAQLAELVPMTLKVVADARKMRIRRW